MTRRRLPRRSALAGYTLVELMMALALFTVGVLGIISLQKITVVSNAHAKNMAVAERVAQSWAAQLQMDSTNWRNGYGTAAWLADPAGTWLRPAHVDKRAFGAAFDALGNALPDSEVSRARYCTHVRFSWLYPTTTGVVGSALMRAEIRVFWQREGESTVDTSGLCAAAQSADLVKKIGEASDLYHFVYKTVGIRQHFQI